MTTANIIALVEACFAGYSNYEAGSPAVIPPQEIDVNGVAARIGVTVQKASGANAPVASELKYNSAAELIHDVETGIADYEAFQAGQLVNVDPIAVPFANDTALISFTIQKVNAGSAAPSPGIASAFRAAPQDATAPPPQLH